MERKELWFVFKSFFLWRIFLFLPVFLAPFFFKLQQNFLGGGFSYFVKNPYFWSWANFDGEHYVNIARMGYSNGEQSFFPLYPLILRTISDIYGFKSPDLLVAAGIVVSNISFILLLIGIYKLAKMDFGDKIARLSVVVTLVFPISFYFAGVYTESLFLCLIVWSFYYYRTEKYLFSGILGLLASATRIIGIALLPVFLIDYLSRKKSMSFKMWPLLLAPFGLFSYMFYSFLTWGDPIKFFNAVSGFGEQRSDHLILLPQVFYRYFFKIIPNLTWDYFPVVFTTILEILSALGFLVFILFLAYYLLRYKDAEKRIVKPDYWFYLVFSYLIPTFSGSFSSFPRYSLTLFPVFIYLAYFGNKLPRPVLVGIILISSIISLIAQMLFVQGYFVS